MNPVTSLVLSVAVLVGAAGGVLAFEHVASPAAPSAAVATSSETAAPAVAPAPHRARRPHGHKVRWAPCPDGSSLEAGVCVTDVVRTVTVPAPAAPAVSHVSTSGSGQHSTGGDDDHGDDHGDGEHESGEGEHEGGDDD